MLNLSKTVKGSPDITKYIYFKSKRIGRVIVRSSGEYNLDSVDYVEIKPEYRGRGIGKEVYRRLNKELNQQGKVLKSNPGGVISPEAKLVWESLVRSGEAEVVENAYIKEHGLPIRFKFKDLK